MKVFLCTMFSPSHQALADITVPNLEEYCLTHGHEMRIINIENDKWEYKKHEAFREYFKEMDEGDIIWYKDVDSIITNLTIPIESLLPDGYDFYLTRDFNELNGGSVVIRNSHWGRKINDQILTIKVSYENEQNIYNSSGFKKPYLEHTFILPHPSINSYKYSIYPECTDCVGREDLGDWAEGHLLLHVPAASIAKRIEILKNAPIKK